MFQVTSWTDANTVHIAKSFSSCLSIKGRFIIPRLWGATSSGNPYNSLITLFVEKFFFLSLYFTQGFQKIEN